MNSVKWYWMKPNSCSHSRVSRSSPASACKVRERCTISRKRTTSSSSTPGKSVSTRIPSLNSPQARLSALLGWW